MSVIPLTLRNKTFCVRSPLFPVTNQQYEQSHRHKDVEIWMSITQGRNYSRSFGYPLLSGNCSTKKIQLTFKKKSCVASKLHVWYCCAKCPQVSYSSSTKKNPTNSKVLFWECVILHLFSGPPFQVRF